MGYIQIPKKWNNSDDAHQTQSDGRGQESLKKSVNILRTFYVLLVSLSKQLRKCFAEYFFPWGRSGKILKDNLVYLVQADSKEAGKRSSDILEGTCIQKA